MAQVTLDGLSREHGKGIDMKSLAVVREQLLDLKIRMKTDEEDKPVPLQQDIRLIDYLQEFDTFIGKRQLPRSRGVCHPSWSGGAAVRDGRAPGDRGMILDRLVLKNFKRFRDDEIRFKDGITGHPRE